MLLLIVGYVVSIFSIVVGLNFLITKNFVLRSGIIAPKWFAVCIGLIILIVGIICLYYSFKNTIKGDGTGGT